MTFEGGGENDAGRDGDPKAESLISMNTPTTAKLARTSEMGHRSVRFPAGYYGGYGE